MGDPEAAVGPGRRIEVVKDTAGKMLAAVLRLSGSAMEEAGMFLTEEHDLLQVGVLTRRAGYKAEVHTHEPVLRETEGTAEVLLVLNGMIRVDIFVDISSVDQVAKAPEVVRRFRLGPHDAVILFPGSVHAVTWLTDAKVFEVKSGPYAGLEDKITGEPDGDAEEERGEPPVRQPVSGAQAEAALPE